MNTYTCCVSLTEMCFDDDHIQEYPSSSSCMTGSIPFAKRLVSSADETSDIRRFAVRSFFTPDQNKVVSTSDLGVESLPC